MTRLLILEPKTKQKTTLDHFKGRSSSISQMCFSYLGTGHRHPLHGKHCDPIHPPLQELDGQLVTENPLQEAPPHEGPGFVQLRRLRHPAPSDLQGPQLLQRPATAGIEAL